MAAINITECKGPVTVQGQTPFYAPVAYFGTVTCQEVTSLTATPQQSSAFQAKTAFLVLVADVAVRFAVGTNPTAGATSTRLPADVVFVIGVPAGQSFKISVRTD